MPQLKYYANNMSNSKVFSPDFREFIELLNVHEVRYMVTGGYAVGIYGYPRYTGDLDFWIENSSENGRKLVKVLSAFGLSSIGLSAEDFTKKEQIIQIGYPPFRIDLLTSIDGVEFRDAYPNRKVFKIDEIQVSFIGLDDLKKNKKASGRTRDIDDLNHLE